MRTDYHRISYRRRGYDGSSVAAGPGSIRRDAADAAALMDALGIDRAHIVGLSFSAAIALEMAVLAPGRVSVAMKKSPLVAS
ncbi:MAG: hypothetical protein L0H24_14680 [Microlunatus sp.]|nr:hypothetical protein [Microlunatus sp.]